jgi:hypothetical protein
MNVFNESIPAVSYVKQSVLLPDRRVHTLAAYMTKDETSLD